MYLPGQSQEGIFWKNLEGSTNSCQHFDRKKSGTNSKGKYFGQIQPPGGRGGGINKPDPKNREEIKCTQRKFEKNLEEFGMRVGKNKGFWPKYLPLQ